MKRGKNAVAAPFAALAALAAGVAAAQERAAAEATTVDDIVVTATPLERTTDELATPVTVLDRDEITRRGAPTLGALLKDELGVAQSSFAPGASRPIIRGLDNFRIRVQENGIGSQGVSALSEDHAVPIDPLAAQRVEVIRGPATLRYGGGAIGGLVSVLNDRIPEFGPEGGFASSVYGGFESVNEGVEGAAAVDFGVERFAGHLDGFVRDSGDYDIPGDDGTQKNTAVESSGAAGGGSFLFDNGYLGASVSFFESEYEIPGGEAAEENLFIDLEQVKVNIAGELTDLGDFVSAIRGRVGYADYTHDEVIGADGVIGSTFNNEAFEGRAELVHAPIAGFEGALGVQGSHRDLSASGEGGELISPATANRFAVFLFEEVSVGADAVLQLGGRVEHVTLDGFGVEVADFAATGDPEIDDLGADRDLAFTPVSASAALIVDVADATKIGLTVQYTERAPSLLELFAKGPHEATATFEIGDPNLGKEKAVSVELTAKRTVGDLRFEAAAFYNAFEDFIFKRLTGLSCGEEFETCGDPGEDELTQIAYSAADATFYGFELGAELDLVDLHGGVLGVDGRFDMVRAEFDDGGDAPRIPPMRFGGGVYYRLGGFNSRIGFLRVNAQDDVAEFETSTKGYNDLSVSASYAFKPGDGATVLEIGVEGSNLLDDEIRNHASFKKEDVLLPGAGARVYGKVRF